MGRLLICIVIVGIVGVHPRWVSGQPSASLERTEQVLLAEAFRLAEQLQDSVWATWSDAPFGMLVVTPEHEFLVRHPRPSDEFAFAAYTEALDSVYVRERQFPANLQATFPAVGGIPTIVIGLPDSSHSPTDWVLTVMHEHFHQWQMSRPGYYAAVDSLRLSGGDDTGQWMLNYPFPYDVAVVQRRFSALTHRLKAALQATDEGEFQAKVDAYLQARKELRDVLAPADYRYFSFQVWQEGVARYVEYKTADRVGRAYVPTDAFKSLRHYEPFAVAARDIKDRILRRLSTVSLGEDKRVAFYPVGAGEALLLDRANPTWQRRYWTDKFYLERYYNGAWTK